MANPLGKCVICGSSPTVKAHLFPRALMLDIRADATHLVSGSLRRAGVRLRQNGEWDDRLLCDFHEKTIGSADDYGVRFCRTWRELASESFAGRAVQIPNREPNELVRFAYAVTWRHAVCKEGRAVGPKLGLYEQMLLERLLGDGPYDLQLLVGINPLTLQGKRFIACIPPFRNRFENYSVIQFTISGLDFYLKTDQRDFPDSWIPFLANDNDPVVLGRVDERDALKVPKFRSFDK